MQNFKNEIRKIHKDIIAFVKGFVFGKIIIKIFSSVLIILKWQSITSNEKYYERDPFQSLYYKGNNLLLRMLLYKVLAIVWLFYYWNYFSIYPRWYFISWLY